MPHGERTAKRRAADARSSRRRARSPAASAPRSDSPRQRSGRPQIPPRPARRGPGSGRPPDRLAPSPTITASGRLVPAAAPACAHSSITEPCAAKVTSEVPSRSRRPASSSSAASVRSGRWWKSTTALAPARRPSSTAYSAAACPKRPSDASSSRVQLCVVDQQVGPPCKLKRSRVVLAAAAWPRAQGGGTMVGHVGERRASVADPVAEGPPTLVGDLPGEHRESLALRRARAASSRSATSPAAGLAPSGSAAETSPGRAPPRRRLRPPARAAAASTRASLAVAGGEERQALDVVPVQVGEQDRAAGTASPPQQLRDGSRMPVPASRIRLGRSLFVIAGDREAGRVPAVAQEVSARRRGRAPHPAEVDPHESSAPRAVVLPAR